MSQLIKELIQAVVKQLIPSPSITHEWLDAEGWIDSEAWED